MLRFFMEKNMFLNLLDIKKSLKNLTSSEENFEKATSPLYSDKDKEKYLEQAKNKLLKLFRNITNIYES